MGICYIRNHNVSECAALKIKYGRKNMNLFENATNEELKMYYQQYKEFQCVGAIPEKSELRTIADAYIEEVGGAWFMVLTTNLLETIADRWMEM